MPRTIENIMDAHHAAEERRAQGQPIWAETIHLADVFRFRNEDMTFEEIRDEIVARLKATRWYANEPEHGTLDCLMEELADAVDPEEFDGVWDEIYDLANIDRVWIETVA